jgi:MFS superfamily sulfate permease-like transporter
MNKSSFHLNRADFLADLKSGFLVFLIALPLCLGISIASGFPAVAGIITAIVGGCVVSCLGGSKLTIKGPAAGLIVIAIGAVTELGQGDMVTGYHRALAVGVAAALLQMLFSFFRVANLGISISKSVVHGMLSAIGVIIIAKQIHVMLGVKPESKDIFGLLFEIPHSILNANPEIATIGIASLVLLFFWPKIKASITKVIPVQIVILAIVIPLSVFLHISEQHSYTFMSHAYSLSSSYLVQLPESLLSAVTLPDFSMIFTLTSIKYIVMFALVGMIESTLSVVAIDGIDPKKRISNLNRDLFALSCGNLIAALLGGLPMISEIVRSKANVDNGATSSRANFFHGLFLLVFVAFLPHLLDLIPLAALAAMLVYVGTRLASISEIKHAKKVGTDQLILFSTTLIVTLATDLLSGVAVGLLLKIILHLCRGVSLKSLFAGRIDGYQEGSSMSFVMHGAAAFPNLFRLRKMINGMPDNISDVTIDVSKTKLIDHTFLSGIKNITNEKSKIDFKFIGLDNFTAISDHPESTRWS